MSATEQDIQTPGRAIPSLGFFAYNALGDAPVKNPGLFKEFPKPCSYAVERYASEDLLHCAGFGMRTKAETTFSAYRRSLLWRGKLTDIAKETYEDITAFEYAVMVKDSHFVRKVVDFLEKYQGEDKREIVANLLEQFDRYFSEERLAAVSGFIDASNAWLARDRIQRDQTFVRDIGEAQAKFPAHILQEYCHPSRSFEPTPSFSDTELPESLDFYNWNNGKISSLCETPPGVAGNFALIRAQRWALFGWDGLRAAPEGAPIVIDCAAVDALDKARTADLLVLKGRLASLLKAEDSLAPHATTPGYSPSGVPS